MLVRAPLCLALSWLASPAQPGDAHGQQDRRDDEGASEVTAPVDEPEVAGGGEEAPSPTETSATSAAPSVSAGRSAAVPPGSSTSPAAEVAAPTPKWWGPFPRPKLTGFGGPVVQGTGLAGNFAAMVGLAGGLTIKRRVSIGATALWLLNPADAGETSVGAPQRLNFNFGGLLLAVVFARTKRVDFTVGGVLGGGGACLQNPSSGSCYARTAMFVGQPELAAHIKLAPIVRLSLGLGYRLVAARGWTGPDSRRLGAPVGTLMLEFGLF